MSTLSRPLYLKRQRKNSLRLFYVFTFLAAGRFTAAVKTSQDAQAGLFALGIALTGVGIWSFFAS
jgi:hypothetical protein